MRKKKRLCVAIVFGGKSTEHGISLRSAKNIVNAIDKSRFEVVLLYIDKNGKWYIFDTKTYLLKTHDSIYITLSSTEKSIALLLGQKIVKLVNPKNMKILKKIDVVFPIVHGAYGEDGSLQGMLRMANLPFIGSDVFGSAACMDKDITKRLLRDAGLKVAPFITITPINYSQYSFSDIRNFLGLPLFVKPANQGSSIGISKVDNETQFTNAMHFAFEFSHKVVVEASIQGREIECALLGGDFPQASTCGEIQINGEFYSYDKKYIAKNGIKTTIPASLNREMHSMIQKVAIAAYKTLNCHGMARVDVFLTPKNEIIINEINTLPGLTDVSMYPKLWQASGLSFSELISKLIKIALERHASLHSKDVKNLLHHHGKELP